MLYLVLEYFVDLYGRERRRAVVEIVVSDPLDVFDLHVVSDPLDVFDLHVLSDPLDVLDLHDVHRWGVPRVRWPVRDSCA